MSEFQEPVVELTTPDGNTLRFRYGAIVPYAGEDYVVLLEMDDTPEGEEQILITRLEEQDGEQIFVVAEEEDVIQAVFDKYVKATTDAALEGLEDAE